MCFYIYLYIYPQLCHVLYVCVYMPCFYIHTYIYIYIYIYIVIHQLYSCVDSQFVMSFDIASLFINFSLAEVISICTDLLYHFPLTSILSLPEVFVELMEIAIKSVYLGFTHLMYRQLDGIMMGSPLSLILA